MACSALSSPCLSRLETDAQASGKQSGSTEDSFFHSSGSAGNCTPALKYLISELAIAPSIARATLDPNSKMNWQDWTGDYSLVRQLIEATYPKDFKDYNERLVKPSGFYRGNNAHDRVWNTPDKKAEFNVPGA